MRGDDCDGRKAVCANATHNISIGRADNLEYPALYPSQKGNRHHPCSRSEIRQG
jgi:hypothetical protein